MADAIDSHSRGSRVIRATGTLGVRLMAALGQVAITLILTNTSSIEDFGVFGAAWALGTVATAIASVGIPQWLLRLDAEQLAAGDRPDLIPSVLRTGLAAVSLAALLAAGIAGWRGGAPAIVTAAALAVAAEGFSMLAQNLWFGRLEAQRAVLLQFGARTLPLAALGLALLAGLPTFPALATGYAIAGLVLLVILREAWRGPWRVLQSLRGGIEYWRATVWAMLQQLDVTIVLTALGPAPAGAYSAAFRVASPVHIVTGLLQSMYIPRLSREDAGPARSDAGRRLVLWGGLYAALVALASPLVAWLAPLVVGRDYAPYRIVFAVLFVNSAISVVNQLLTAWLYADGILRPVAGATRWATLIGLAAIAGLAWGTGEVVFAAVGCAMIQVILLAQLVVVRRRHR